MFTIVFILTIIAVIVGLIIWWPTRHKASYDRDDSVLFPALLAFFIVGLFWIMGVGTLTSDQINNKNTLPELQGQRKELVAYERKVEDNIRESLSKYPAFEGKIIEDIDPVILVNYPDLKSSKTIVKQFEALQSVDKKLFNNKNRELRIRKEIANNEDNPLYWGMIWG
jgi:hypothetical protein